MNETQNQSLYRNPVVVAALVGVCIITAVVVGLGLNHQKAGPDPWLSPKPAFVPPPNLTPPPALPSDHVLPDVATVNPEPVDNAGPPPFGAASVSEERAEKRRERYHWYPLDDDQYAALAQALQTYKPAKPILILVATTDAIELAEDLDTAFRDAGFKSEINMAMDSVEGIRTPDQKLAQLLTAATRIPVTIETEPQPESDFTLLDIGRKVVKK